MRRNLSFCLLPISGMLFSLNFLTGCGGSSFPSSNGKSESLFQLVLSPQTPALAKGTSLQLTATAVYNDGKTQDVTNLVIWKTSDSTKVVINNGGTLTALGVGSAKISAQYQDVSDTDSVAIRPAALVSIGIVPNSYSLPLGESQQFIATGTFTDKSTEDLTHSATWISSGPSVAGVSSTGMAVAKSVGNATISASVANTSGSAALNVNSAVLVSITVTASPSSLPVGESEQLIVTGTYSDQSTRVLTQSATWSSSGSWIASVSSAGLLTAKTLGKITVSATVGNAGGSAQVSVTAAAPVALNISPSPISMTLGGSQQLSAIATYSDGSTQDVTSTAQWSSSAQDIVNVGTQGLSIAEEIGDATISATEQNLSVTASATVIPPALIHYFDLAAAQSSKLDPTVFLTNPGLVPSTLCGMIYVFDQKQEMNECCGCTISDNGLRVLSLDDDLTDNPLTGVKPKTGTIKIVASDITSNPQCDPSSLAPTGLLQAWGTNARNGPGGTSQFVETEFTRVPLESTESTTLANLCSAVQKLGNKHGACSCGTGN